MPGDVKRSPYLKVFKRHMDDWKCSSVMCTKCGNYICIIHNVILYIMLSLYNQLSADIILC